MISLCFFCRTNTLQPGNWPGPWAWPSSGTAETHRQRLSRLDFSRGTSSRIRRWSSFSWGGDLFVSAPGSVHHLSVNAVTKIVFGQTVPEKAGSGIIHQWEVLIETVALIHGALTAPIDDGPNLLDKVGSGGSIGPKVAVSGDVAALVEVVEHSKLQCKFVLVGSDVGAVHGQ